MYYVKIEQMQVAENGLTLKTTRLSWGTSKHTLVQGGQKLNNSQNKNNKERKRKKKKEEEDSD